MITPRILVKSAVSVIAVGTLAFSTASAQTLLLQYEFDEASGPAIDTGTGTALHGSLEGGAFRSPNAPYGSGNAVSFLNDDPYAHVLGGDADKLDGLQQFTLTTWLNVSEYLSGNHRLSAKQSGGNFGGFSWNMNATPNSGTVGADNFRLALFVGNNLGTGGTDFGAAFSDADVNADNRWVFLAVTYDGTNGAVNYYMGDEASSVGTLGGTQTTAAVTVDGGTARFGVGFTDAAPTANTSVIGLQDDVRVYSGVLNQAQLEGVRVEAIPEPSTYAAIFGGLALLFAAGRRIRRNRA